MRTWAMCIKSSSALSIFENDVDRDRVFVSHPFRSKTERMRHGSLQQMQNAPSSIVTV